MERLIIRRRTLQEGGRGGRDRLTSGPKRTALRLSTWSRLEEAKEVEEVIASLREAHEPAADDSGGEDDELIQVVDGEVVFNDVVEDEEGWYKNGHPYCSPPALYYDMDNGIILDNPG